MAHAAIDIAGSKFGRLTVKSRVGTKSRQPIWACVCDCGGEIDVASSSLKSGCTQSCGCLNIEVARAKRTRHGMFGTPEFAAWSHMIQRCTNPNDDSYADYGARGITVCDRWKNDFLNFFADMGPRPTGMTLERDEVNGNYEPGNCRWATKKEQANNTRRNRLIELDGERGTLQWWADKTGIGRGTIAWRLNRGWSVKEALTP